MEVRLSSAPSIVVVGGPNGAGKTTTAPFLLRDALGVREYVNADPIAAGLSAFAQESVAIAAARVMLARLDELARQRVSRQPVHHSGVGAEDSRNPVGSYNHTRKWVTRAIWYGRSLRYNG